MTDSLAPRVVREPDSPTDCLVAAIGSWFRSRLSPIDSQVFPTPIMEGIRPGHL